MPDRDHYVDKSAPPKQRAATAVPEAVEDAPTSPIDRENKPEKKRIKRAEDRIDGLEVKVANMDGKLDVILENSNDAKIEREVRSQREIAAAAERREILNMRERRWTATLPIVVPLVVAIGTIITAIILHAPAPAVAPAPAPVLVPTPVPIGGSR